MRQSWTIGINIIDNSRFGNQPDISDVRLVASQTDYDTCSISFKDLEKAGWDLSLIPDKWKGNKREQWHRLVLWAKPMSFAELNVDVLPYEAAYSVNKEFRFLDRNYIPKAGNLTLNVNQCEGWGTKVLNSGN